MNKTMLIVLGLVLGGFILLLSIFWLRQHTQTPPLVSPLGTTTPPFPIPGPGPNPSKMISIKTGSGTDIQVKDFLHDPELVTDPITPGNYYLGNNFITNGDADVAYVVEYIEQSNFFNIVLYKEPIAQSRKQAEQYLMAHLGISQSQMCSLRYMVGVPHSVNEFYTATSLGFSFCPGSVQIPG